MRVNPRLGYCPRRWHRRRSVDDRCPATTPMASNFHYSTPDPIPTNTLADMIQFYASPEMRAEFHLDEELLSETMETARSLIAVWTPTTEWHRDLVRHGRHLQWLIWQVANSHDESMLSIYTDLEQVVEPWAIEISTLFDYRDLFPAPQTRPDAPEI